ncbi:hypothetical protein IRJ41_016395, partial [Triplophysa rosa]
QIALNSFWKEYIVWRKRQLNTDKREFEINTKQRRHLSPTPQTSKRLNEQKEKKHLWEKQRTAETESDSQKLKTCPREHRDPAAGDGHPS